MTSSSDLREETGKEKQGGGSYHEWLESPGSSPGRGEGLPIFLPLNGESWRCFHCAGQSDSLPNIGLHYCGLALVHFQPAKFTSTAKDIETSLLRIWPSAWDFSNHRPYFLPIMAKGGLCTPIRALMLAITNIHSQHSEKSSLYEILLQSSTAWCCTPVSQLNPLETAALVLIATLWITVEEALTVWMHGKQYEVLHRAPSKLPVRCLSGSQKWAFLGYCYRLTARKVQELVVHAAERLRSGPHNTHVLCSLITTAKHCLRKELNHDVHIVK